MRILGRKYAITGAGRGLGAALCIVMADCGAIPILLGRSKTSLDEVAKTIEHRTGQLVDTIICDLANADSCLAAGTELTQKHTDLDGVVHNGAMWLPGVIGDISAQDIQSCVFSAAIGSLILTQKVLPTLCARPDADIHTIVSTSGLSYMPLGGTSIAFKAAKSAQDGFVHGMTDELSKTNVRVTAIYPGNFDDVSPLVPAWNSSKIPGDALTNREVVDAILFTLNLPPNAAVRTLVLE